MQVNLSTQDINYLTDRSGLTKSRVHQIVRKSNVELFVLISEKVFDEVD